MTLRHATCLDPATDRALDAAASEMETRADWLRLALACLDQAGEATEAQSIRLVRSLLGSEPDDQDAALDFAESEMTATDPRPVGGVWAVEYDHEAGLKTRWFVDGETVETFGPAEPNTGCPACDDRGGENCARCELFAGVAG